MRHGLYAMVVALAIGAFASGPAVVRADPSSLPPFDGVLAFPAIHGPSDPEEYSWEVQLGEGQALKPIDAESIGMYSGDGTQVMLIRAHPAHGANGKVVATTISLSEGNVITQTVHHNVTGTVYPVTGGAAWESGLETVELVEPSRANPGSEPSAKEPSNCLVPRLKGGTLKGSERRLEKAGCKIGSVGKRKGVTARTGKVVKQNPNPGTTLAPGAAVSVVLGEGRPVHRTARANGKDGVRLNACLY